MGTNASRKTPAAVRVLAVLLAALMVITLIPMSAMAAGGDYKLADFDAADVTKVVLTDVNRGFYFDEGMKMNIEDGDLVFTVTCGKDKAGNDITFKNVSKLDDLDRLGIKWDPANDTKMTVEDHEGTYLGLTYNKGAVDVDESLVDYLEIFVDPSPVFYARVPADKISSGEWYVFANGTHAPVQALTENAVNFSYDEVVKKYLKALTISNEEISLDDEMIDIDYEIPEDIVWEFVESGTYDNGNTGYFINAMIKNKKGVWETYRLCQDNQFEKSGKGVKDTDVSAETLGGKVCPVILVKDSEVNANVNATWYIEKAKDTQIYTLYEGYSSGKGDLVADFDGDGKDETVSVKFDADYYGEKFNLFYDAATDSFKAMWDGITGNRTLVYTVTAKATTSNGTKLAKGDMFFENKNGKLKKISSASDAKKGLASDPDQAKVWKENKAAMLFTFYASEIAEPTAIKVVEQPQLVYEEGDTANIEDMVVEVFFGNDYYSKKIPYRLFKAYDIHVKLTDKFNYKDGEAKTDLPLTYAKENGTVFEVFVDGHQEIKGYSDKITVSKSPILYFELAEKVQAGNYVIASVLPADAKLSSFVSTGALGSDKSIVEYTRPIYGNDPKSFEYGYQNIINPVVIKNDRIDKDNSAVGKKEIWTLTKAAGDGWYIVSSDGKYLSRYAYDDVDINVRAQGHIPVTTVDKKDAVEENIIWSVSGSRAGLIYAQSAKDNLYYVLVLGGNKAVKKLDKNTDTPFENETFYCYAVEDIMNGNIPASIEYGTLKGGIYNLYQAVYADVAKVEIYKQPKLDYASGDALDLSKLIVKITYANGGFDEVPYVNFEARGITTDYQNGQTLKGADNGKTIVVSYKGKTASTDALKVDAGAITAAVERISGTDRISTAIAVADKAFTSASTVVIANGWSNVDALSVAGLAGKLNAPILIVSANDYTKAVEEAKKLGATQAYIVGGTAAVSEAITVALENGIGCKCDRLSGTDRIATSLAVAEKLSGFDTIFVVGSNNYVDALSAGSIAAAKGAPILYTGSKTLDAGVKDYLAKNTSAKVVILGGTSAVSAAVEAEIKGVCANVSRIAGLTRFETSANINAAYSDLFTSKNVAIASGDNDRLCDALAGSVYAAQQKMPIVLVDNAYSNDYAYNYISGRNVDTVVVFGGEAAVASETVDAVLGK